MLKICRLGLIQDKVWTFVDQTENGVTISTTFNVFGTSTYSTMEITLDNWEKAVEAFIFSGYYQKLNK